MKFWPLIVASAVWLFVAVSRDELNNWIVIIGGDTNGYLSPCGCTKPMIGGIRKRATLIRSLALGHNSLILENGGMISGQGRQDELKAETLAECLRSAGVDGVTFGYSEAKFGKGMLITLNQLTRNRLINSALEQSPTNELQPWIEKGPFLVGALDVRTNLLAGAIDEKGLEARTAATKVAQEAESRGLVPILMLQGSREDAARIATAVPALKLIVFRSDGNAIEEPVRVGNSLLISPGGKGLYLSSIRFANGKFSDYRATRVEAALKDNSDSARLFKEYLLRVEREGLLAKLPRLSESTYVGSVRCAECHSKSYDKWKDTGHALALRALEKVGQSKDPDCVGCHVVGASSKFGFVSRAKTPALADVGCESCHGAGAEHSEQPKVAKMPRIGEQVCLTCHRPDQSPEFDFPKFWKKIEHK